MVAHVLGGIADAHNQSWGVTWAKLMEWIPCMTTHDISATLIDCLEYGWVDVRPNLKDEQSWSLSISGKGWMILADIVQDNPTQLGWATIMPATFQPAMTIESEGIMP